MKSALATKCIWSMLWFVWWRSLVRLHSKNDCLSSLIGRSQQFIFLYGIKPNAIKKWGGKKVQLTWRRRAMPSKRTIVEFFFFINISWCEGGSDNRKSRMFSLCFIEIEFEFELNQIFCVWIARQSENQNYRHEVFGKSVANAALSLSLFLQMAPYIKYAYSIIQ